MSNEIEYQEVCRQQVQRVWAEAFQFPDGKVYINGNAQNEAAELFLGVGWDGALKHPSVWPQRDIPTKDGEL